MNNYSLSEASRERDTPYFRQVRWMRGSPIAQLVKNLSAMQETSVLSLGWEDPLKKGMASHSNILAWRIQYSPCDCKELDMPE